MLGPALEVPGRSFLSIRCQQSWESRFARYGATGCSRAGLKRIRKALRRRLKADGHPASRKTHCIHGHEYAVVGTKLDRRGRRMCLAFYPPRRPQWVVVKDCGEKIRVCIRVHDAWHRREVRRLWRAVCRAHPDRRPGLRSVDGAGFKEAKAGYDNFLRREKTWYRAMGLKPPIFNRKARSHSWETRRLRYGPSGLKPREAVAGRA